MSESNLQALVIQKVDNPIRERSMQFLTQLCVKKKKNSHQAAYGHATARRYWSIHELTVIFPARAMYG